MRETPALYWEVLGPLRRRALLAIVVAATGGLLEVVGIAMLIPILDAGGLHDANGLITTVLSDVGLRGHGLLWVAIASFCTLGVLAALCGMVSELLSLRIRAHVEQRLRREAAQALIGMKYSAFLGMRFGDLSSAIMMEGGQTSLGVLAFLKTSSSAIIALIFLVMAVMLDWRTTLFTVTFALIVALTYSAGGRRAQTYGKLLTIRARDIGNQVGDVLGNLKLFRSTGARAVAQLEMERTFAEFAELDFKASMYKGLSRFVFEGGGVLFVGGVMALSIVTTGQITSGALVFLALFYRLMPRMGIAQENLLVARTQSPWYRSWSERMCVARTSQDVRVGARSPRFTRELVIHDVDFQFPGSDRLTLTDITLAVRKGQTVAIVGESGSGKTTLVDLITGLIEPTRGAIEVDGVALADLDIEAWQRGIGLVLQDSPIFHATVLSNIAWLSGSPDYDRAWRCAELAHARQFIERLPAGMDTVVGERGGRLSGGQRQRIALARALYRHPDLLILDEATSALDAESEASVQEALLGLKGTVAIVLVAHRLKTVQLADTIVVLEQGRVVETGSWDELLAHRARFHAMAAGQGMIVEVRP